METWDYAHCLPYFKRMENCLAAEPDDPFRGHDGPLVLESGDRPRAALRRVLRRRAAGGVSADRRRERLPAGGLRGLRPQRAPRAPAVRGAGVPAPGDGAAEPDASRRSPSRPGSSSRAAARSASSTRAPGEEAGRHARGGRLLCGGAINSPQLLQLSGVGARRRAAHARHRRSRGRARRGENLQDHLEVYVQHSSTQPVSMAPYFAMQQPPEGGARVAAAQDRSGRDEPLRGGRVRAQQRRRGVPQPHVPLPADRGPLRRHAAARRRRPRLPGARGADVLGRARHRQGRQPRPGAGIRRCASTTSRPSRTGASGSRRSA